jgi:hypothetical protein
VRDVLISCLLVSATARCGPLQIRPEGAKRTVART